MRRYTNPVTGHTIGPKAWYALKEIERKGAIPVFSRDFLGSVKALGDAIHLTEYNPPRRMAQYAEPVRAIARAKV